MRITHLVPHRLDPYSGVYTSVIGMTLALARAGHDVKVWNLSPWPAERADLVAALDEAGVVRRELAESFRPWSLTRGAKHMVDSELDADIVHFHSAFSPQNNLLARRIDHPMVLSPHGVLLPGSMGKSPIRKQVYRRLIELPTLRKMAAVCALTEAEQAEVREFGYAGRIAVIPNGVPDPPPGLDSAALRRRLSIDPSTRVGLYVGRIQIDHKRLDVLARAVSEALDWHLVVVGGDYRGDAVRLESLVADLPGSERIHLLGAQQGTDLAEAYAGADALMLVSHSEGMSMALLEAFSHRLPALVSPEVEEALPVAASGAGWTATPARLAGELARLAGLSETEWEAARAGAGRLADAFRWETIAESYLSLYRSVIES